MAYSKQTWDTTSYVNPTRMNHIEQGIYDASTATGTEYSSGVSVKDKIDDNFTNTSKMVYRNVANTTETFTLDTNYHSYLLSYYAGGNARSLTWIACRSNTDYAIVDIIGTNNITWNNGQITWGTSNYHTTGIVQIS